MRRFEFAEGSSNKFWEVTVSGNTLTVRFGRVVSKGHEKSKTFATPELAQKEQDKLIAEKLGRGYTKAGGADCVQKCWRGGASVGHPEWKPQRPVFVADDDQGIWIVENPEAVRNFPGAHVVLAGKFDSAKKTINIEKITPASQ